MNYYMLLGLIYPFNDLCNRVSNFSMHPTGHALVIANDEGI